ncbi:MAG: MarR family winged helix-turn-helix transcriptional regulator [Deltaproteobacteria bacterium]
MKRKNDTGEKGPGTRFEDINLEECLDCVCYEVSKTSRYVINYYDAALRDIDLRSNQFIILAAVANMKSTNFKNLAGFVGIDPSTLARNLTTLEKQSFVRVKSGENRREKVISLTRKGKNKFEKAYPLWKKAQAGIIKELGKKRWRTIRGDLSDIVSITREQD